MTHTDSRVTVIGGGLAGTEAALQLARRGIPVTLYEMRPAATSPAHHTGWLAELVCSNSFKSDDPETAAGLLKRELEEMGCVTLQVARRHAVAAGGALAVDRESFSRALTGLVEAHPLIRLVRAVASDLPPGPVIIATGPLTSPEFEPVLTDLVGGTRLAFYDAAAPVVETASLRRDVIFGASRYGKGGASDYLNAPLDRAEYERFHAALIAAERVVMKDFEQRDLFKACQPVEEVARTGIDALRYGAMKPVGLIDPRTGERPWAVVQLRAENVAGTAYNLVGFQTNLTWPEQRRVFSLIPGLEDAEFARFGVMHRNTFVDSPKLLTPSLTLRSLPDVCIAGQLAGTEGYLEAVASGLLAALSTYAGLIGAPPAILPTDTAFGALVAYATDPATERYQPMHVNFGIVPPLSPPVRSKRARYAAYSERARASIAAWRSARRDLFEGVS